MWPQIRKYKKVCRKCLLIFLLFVVLIQLKSQSNFYFGRRTKLRGQYAPLSDYVPIIDFLQSINITLVVIDPAMLTYGQLDPRFVTFGIMENHSHQLKRAAASGATPYFWYFREHRQIDYRILNLTRSKHNVSAHFTFSYAYDQSMTFHLAVIFQRNDYFWISEFTDHEFVDREFNGNTSSSSLALPMAVEQFACRQFRVSEYHTFCVPKQRNHYLWQLQYARFLECPYEEVVWKFEKDYPATERVDTGPHAAALQEMMRIGRKFESPIVIAFGTLLGWYRQCDYIVHSRDIDTAMFAHDFSYDIFKELWLSKLLRIYIRMGTPEKGLEFRSYGAGTVWFDLFLMYPFGENYYTYMIHTILLEWHRSKYPMMNEICSADLLGVLVHLPCDPTRYILSEYGPDNWYTPGQRNYLNIEIVEKFNNSEIMSSHIHTYKTTCEEPSLLWGCDPEGETGMPLQ